MLDKLELLLMLAEARHFGRAAEKAGVSQPTLSSSVKSLEDQLGVVLVERGSRFRGFTPEGERVLAWARRLVGDARTMRLEIEALRRGIAGELKLGAIPTALAAVPGLTVPFVARHPAVAITIYSLTSAAILQRMENLELDAGLTYIDNEATGPFRKVPLYLEQYALLMSRSDPDALGPSITWAAAARKPLCLLTPDMQNRRIIDRHLADAGGAVPGLQSNSMMLLSTHVRTGRWATIIPTRLITDLDQPAGLVAVPLVEPTVTHAIGLLVPDREPMKPVVAALLAVAGPITGVQGK
jgi:DNA-binding transcriptional LysR family regulator